MRLALLIAGLLFIQGAPRADVTVFAGGAYSVVETQAATVWPTAGIPTGCDSVAQALVDNEFRDLMRQEANGDAEWAYWTPNVAPPFRGSSNLELNLEVIEQEADGTASWARWSPGTGLEESGNLQVCLRDALAADFVPGA